MAHYISEENNLMKCDQGAIIAYGSIYADKKPAILIKGAKDDAPVTKATTNVPDSSLKRRIVAIKNYSENEGVLATLVNAGIVAPLIAMNQGHATIDYVFILDDTIIEDIKEALEERGE
jgi:hypothetical protein